jgi:phospholipase C
LRQFRGAGGAVEVSQTYDAAAGTLRLLLRNTGSAAVTLRTTNAYASRNSRTHQIAPGAEVSDTWRIDDTGHWYDVSVTSADDPKFLRRLAGHIETGRPSRSDPALDWVAA